MSGQELLKRYHFGAEPLRREKVRSVNRMLPSAGLDPPIGEVRALFDDVEALRLRADRVSDTCGGG